MLPFPLWGQCCQEEGGGLRSTLLGSTPCKVRVCSSCTEIGRAGHPPNTSTRLDPRGGGPGSHHRHGCEARPLSRSPHIVEGGTVTPWPQHLPHLSGRSWCRPLVSVGRPPVDENSSRGQAAGCRCSPLCRSARAVSQAGRQPAVKPREAWAGPFQAASKAGLKQGGVVSMCSPQGGGVSAVEDGGGLQAQLSSAQLST